MGEQARGNHFSTEGVQGQKSKLYRVRFPPHPLKSCGLLMQYNGGGRDLGANDECTQNLFGRL